MISLASYQYVHTVLTEMDTFIDGPRQSPSNPGDVLQGSTAGLRTLGNTAQCSYSRPEAVLFSSLVRFQETTLNDNVGRAPVAWRLKVLRRWTRHRLSETARSATACLHTRLSIFQMFLHHSGSDASVQLGSSNSQPFVNTNAARGD